MRNWKIHAWFVVLSACSRVEHGVETTSVSARENEAPHAVEPSSSAQRSSATDASASPSAAAPSPANTTTLLEVGEIRVPLPPGYRDTTAEVPSSGLSLVLSAPVSRFGYLPTIAFRKVPIPGGTFGDAAMCSRTGQSFLGATEGMLKGAVLKSALIVDGPTGKTCQMHIVAPQAVALMTELPRPGNIPSSPKDIWLMTCNHAPGDDRAESACRATVAGFGFGAP